MDAIADRVFTDPSQPEELVGDPLLLTVILDTSPKGWLAISNQTTFQEVAQAMLVFVNAHLSLNNSNQVAVITSGPGGLRFVFPHPDKTYDDAPEGDGLINKGMYRQFRVVDESVLAELNRELETIGDTDVSGRSSLSGALSIALTYTNRMLTLDQLISTTTASAINSTTNASTTSTTSGGAQAPAALTSMKSRVLIITANDDDNISYIPIMNTIFAAQKMRLSIDVAKLGFKNSSYLQQAADATNGVYLHIQHPQGLIQTLCTAFFVDPSIRPLIVLPTISNVNYRASCFITGKSVDLGYVCLVCLCILSVIPETGRCPTCDSKFEDKILHLLRRKPIVTRKKRRVDDEQTQ